MRVRLSSIVLLVSCGGAISQDESTKQDASTSTWSPSQLHLALWLEESGIESTGDTVSMWRDHSGTANDAVPTGPAQVEGTLLNGHLLVRPNPQGFIVQDTNAIRWGTSDFMIGVVLRWSAAGTAPAPPRVYYRPGSNAADAVLLGVTAYLAGGNLLTGGAFFQAADGFIDPPKTQIPMSAFHVVIGRGNTPFELHVDDAVYNGAPSDANCANAVSAVSVLALDGDVAELVVATATTDEDEAKLAGYLKAKFAL